MKWIDIKIKDLRKKINDQSVLDAQKVLDQKKKDFLDLNMAS
tara:strand:- start:556 stop:681 length:126 start_codon:yes stop_codon:yes gene_type:complete